MATRKRLRSPAYPAIDLPTAIHRVEQFHGFAGKTAVTISHVVEHWGYKSASSNGMKIVAALGYYGLIKDTGAGDKRKIQLTDKAWRIVVDHEESDVRAQAIIDAALSPKVYQDLWDEWGSNLPPDAEVRSHLIFEKKFNEKAVNGFITDYRSTIEFAGLLETDTIIEQNQEPSGDNLAIVQSDIRPAPPRVQGAKSIEIPIPTTPWPVLTVAVPMTEERWDQMMAMLNAMKPAIVKEGDGDENGN